MDNFRSEEIPETLGKAVEVFSLRLFLIELVQIILLSGFFFIVIDTFIGRVRVENISMEPTLQPGEFIMVNKYAYRSDNYQRGDIIIFHAPPNPKVDYIKRLIGLPGDQILVINGKVSVNGTLLDEPYISAPPTYSGSWTVPEKSIFVLGDNRNSSEDSHEWGFVPYDSIVGRALVIYWPFTKFRILDHPKFMVSTN